jgi:polar amino acid transport system substrate-binding protein
LRKRVSAAVLLITVFGLVAAACSKSTDTGSSTSATTGPSGSSAPAVSTLVAGKLKVASCLDFKPFEYYEGTTLKGFDVELSEAIAQKLGLEVEWVKADFETIFTALAAKQFDMVAAASTIKPDRQKIVNFSTPYYASEQSLVVNATKTPDITSTDDLTSSDTIGVQKGTTGKDWAEENLATKGVKISTFSLAPDAFTALEAGQITGIINDAPASAAIIATRPDLKLVQLIDTHENYGLAIAKTNPTLLTGVNQALADLLADGTYAEIYTKYFPGVPVPTAFPSP